MNSLRLSERRLRATVVHMGDAHVIPAANIAEMVVYMVESKIVRHTLA